MILNFYDLKKDTNNDGIVNWLDFEAAVEVDLILKRIIIYKKTLLLLYILSYQKAIVPKEDAERNSRLKILRKRLEQNFQKYFWDLCEVGDANKDGNIDLEEWLDVMNDIIIHLKQNGKFPEWYEGLHKALFRSNEFYGKTSNNPFLL